MKATLKWESLDRILADDNVVLEPFNKNARKALDDISLGGLTKDTLLKRAATDNNLGGLWRNLSTRGVFAQHWAVLFRPTKVNVNGVEKDILVNVAGFRRMLAFVTYVNANKSM